MDAPINKTPFYKRWWVWVLGVFFLLVIIGMSGGSATRQQSISDISPQNPQGPAKSTFSQLARTRFDNILKSSPELTDITCESNDCGYVVYFDYKTVPDDLDFVIRGNAVTFSKFKLDNTGVSNVTVIARYNGRVLESCDAGQGKVKQCQ